MGNVLMANKFDFLTGKEVVFTGGEQEGTFVVGKAYPVERGGNCFKGEGVMVGGEKHGFVIIAGSFEVAEPKKPTPLNLRQFLQALYEEENVVSVDGEDVDDTYGSLEALADDLAFFEVEDNEFYLEDDWLAYVAKVTEAQDLNERIAEAITPAPEPVAVEPTPEALTFAEAVLRLTDGQAVYSVDKDGDTVDTYHTLADLRDLATFETECKWYEKF
jgi:hypothetical protein